MAPALLNPLRNPGVALGLWSHKLLRWLGSVALLVMIVAALAMAALGLRPLIVGGVLGFLATGLVGLVASRTGRSIPVTGSVYSFLLANAGFLLGLAKALTGQRIVAYRSEGAADESGSP